MTAPRHPDERVNAFLAEGPTDLPDQVFDAVRGEIHRTRQRAVLGPWKEPNMSSFARVAFAAAAIGVIALAWVNFGPSNSGPGTTPSPSPTQSIVPSEPSSDISPGPICSNSGCSAGTLGPGTYTFEAGTFTPVQISFTVPAGWAIDGEGFITKHADEPGELYFAPWVVTHIFPDACLHEDATVISAGTTTAELASVLAAQKSRVASAITDVSVGGLPAKHLELMVPADLDLATCTGGTVRPWPDPGPNLGGGYCCLPAGSVDDVSIVDVGLKRVVIVARHQPGSSEADQAELQAIVDSVAITPFAEPSGTTPSP